MDKREHIILKAIELFSEWGFDNTSIREISKKAGVNVAMINYYFGSKDKLFEAMIEYKSQYLKVRLQELRENTSLSEIEKLDIIIEEYVTRILANPRYHRILHQELLLKTRPEVNTMIKNLFITNSHIIKSILDDGKAKNLFQDVDNDLTIATMFGTINHYMQTFHSLALDTKEMKEAEDETYLRPRLINHLQNMIRSYLLKTETKIKENTHEN